MTDPPVTAVILDLDDTLLVDEAGVGIALQAAAPLAPGIDPHRFERTVRDCARRVWLAGPHHEQCRALGIASWEGLWADFGGCHPALDGLRDWVPGYRRSAWESALAELRLDPGLWEAMSDAYREAQANGHAPIDGAAEAVAALADRYRLGLLTNGPADIQRHKLARSGLASQFEAVVVSGEIGAGKPSPEAFAAVLDRLSAGPDQTVMVGDSWERDVLGALASGVAPVWVAAGRRPPEKRADVRVVSSVADLPALLGAATGSGATAGEP